MERTDNNLGKFMIIKMMKEISDTDEILNYCSELDKADGADDIYRQAGWTNDDILYRQGDRTKSGRIARPLTQQEMS